MRFRVERGAAAENKVELMVEVALWLAFFTDYREHVMPPISLCKMSANWGGLGVAAETNCKWAGRDLSVRLAQPSLSWSFL